MSKPKTIRVLGLDPSLTAFGWAICTMHNQGDDIGRFTVRDAGCQVTKPMTKAKKKHSYVGEDDVERAISIATVVAHISDETAIDCVSYEISGGAQSARASRALGIAAGITASAAGMVWSGALVHGITATDAKQFAVFNAVATKEKMIEWAESISPASVFAGQTKERKSGMADAIAIAYSACLLRPCLSFIGAKRVERPRSPR